MKVELRKTFHFEAAHALLCAPQGHRCRNLHGHTYQVDVIVMGEVPEGCAWYMDYGDIKKAVEPLIAQLDHKMLNDVAGLQYPTSEHLCIWLWEHLHKILPGLREIRVRETPTSQCRYRGPKGFMD